MVERVEYKVVVSQDTSAPVKRVVDIVLVVVVVENKRSVVIKVSVIPTVTVVIEETT